MTDTGAKYIADAIRLIARAIVIAAWYMQKHAGFNTLGDGLRELGKP